MCPICERHPILRAERAVEFTFLPLPFFSKVDWSHREAMILLRERENAGIFPIDKNFVDPAQLELPTDDELGDTEIYC